MRVVMKFGGGVLRDAECYQRVAKTIADRKAAAPEDEYVIVVSAVYGVTDTLIQGTRQAMKSSATVAPFVRELRKQHSALTLGLRDDALRKGLNDTLSEKIDRLMGALTTVAEQKELRPHEEDFINSYGERLSCVLLASYLNDSGCQSAALDAEDAGVVTDGVFGNARPLIPQVERNLGERLVPQLKEGQTIVITGYYGVSVGGLVTTFGRGGSDYSAAILTACLNADSLEIWKDVPGFMTASPRVVSQARFIPRLSYDEAEELSYFGAEILHPRTVAPLREKGIKAAIRSVFSPGDEGTNIGERRERAGGVIKSIAVKRDIALLNVKGGRDADVPGFAWDVFSAMQEASVSVDAIATSQTDISFTISRTDLSKATDALGQLEKRDLISRWHYDDDNALVGVVGDGMRETPGVAGRVFTALSRTDSPINLEMISQGASEINISFVVKHSRVDECVRLIHEEFFGEGK